MYNGIGLATARGSGTNGYVVKNLSTFRPRDGPPGGFGTASNFDDFPKHRQPDQGILDHERKRQVEVKCLELTDELEEKGLPEEEILKQVSALRSKLLSSLPAAQGRHFKPYETHSIAQAKEAELARMRGAFGVSNDYKEGASFDREEQERLRALKRAQYEEKDRLRAERMFEQEQQAEQRKEEEKKKRREEERRRIAAEREAARAPPLRVREVSPESVAASRPVRPHSPSPPRRTLRDSRSRSPALRRRSLSRDSRSPSPVRRRRDSSTPPRMRRQRDSSTPPRARRVRDSSTPPRVRRRSSSPPTTRQRYSRDDSRSPSPPPRRRD